MQGLTWNFFLAQYCMRRMTLMVARWCSRSLWWRREGRGWSSHVPAAVRACRGCPSVPGHMAGPLKEQGGCSASADGDLQAAVLLAGGKADAEAFN